MDETTLLSAAGAGGVVVGLIEVIKMLVGKMKQSEQSHTIPTDCALAKERYNTLKDGLTEVKEETREINKSMNSLVNTQERFLSKMEVFLDRSRQ